MIARLNHQNGNVLFLILIAVALFAALSYAVTQSTRGGGNADDETGLVNASIIFQQGAAIQSAILRAEIMKGVDQVRLTAEALDPAGTVYNPDDTTSTGTILGIYNGTDGTLSRQDIPESLRGTASGTLDWAINYTWVLALDVSVSIAGTDAGTALGDEWLFAGPLSQSACESINKAIYGNTTISNASYSNSTAHHTSFVDDSNADQLHSGIYAQYNLPYEQGCIYITGIVNNYFYSHGLIKTN